MRLTLALADGRPLGILELRGRRLLGPDHLLDCVPPDLPAEQYDGWSNGYLTLRSEPTIDRFVAHPDSIFIIPAEEA